MNTSATETKQHKAEATISIRLPRATAEAIQKRAREHKVTTSELIRALIEEGMAAWGIGDA